MTGYATVSELARNISTEILVAAGLPRTGVLQTLLRPLVWPPARRFASLAAGFERHVAQGGLTAGVRWVLPRWVNGFSILRVTRTSAWQPYGKASAISGRVVPY